MGESLNEVIVGAFFAANMNTSSPFAQYLCH
jgi:hypothetical protein